MQQSDRRLQAVQRAQQLHNGHSISYGDEVLHPGGLKGLCQKAVRIELQIGPGYSSAIIAWSHVAHADRIASKQAPAGIPGYFDIGNYGHAVLMNGDGRCWSTDILRSGQVDLVDVDYIVRHWGARWLGAAKTCNGVRVYGSAA